MKRLLVLLGCSALSLGLGACGGDHKVTGSNVITGSSIGGIVGSGVSATEARPIGDFEAVSVVAPLRVQLLPGGAPSLEITADDNLLPLVRSEVRGGRLFLDLRPETSLTSIREIVCRATFGRLRELDASAAARLEVSGLEGDRLDVRLSGASTAGATGTVGELVLDVSGASRWHGPDLFSRSVRANLSGGSRALLRAKESLEADVSGVSTLEYVGDPVVVSNVSGLSVIRRVGS